MTPYGAGRFQRQLGRGRPCRAVCAPGRAHAQEPLSPVRATGEPEP